YPFQLMVDRLQRAPDLSRSPVFQASFTLHQSDLPNGSAMSLFAVRDPSARMTLGDLEVEPFPFAKKTAEYDVALSIAASRHGLAGTLEFNTDLFDRTTIERMAVRLKTLLGALTTSPDSRVLSAALVAPGETRSLIAPALDWN